MRLPGAIALAGATVALLAAGLGVVAASPSPSAPANLLTWSKWQHLPGVVDLGLQPDGTGLVAEGGESLFTVNRAGEMAALNMGGSYHNAGGFEAYFAVSAGEPVAGTCRFQHGAIYVIDPKNHKQVLQVDPATGRPTQFASVPGVDSLNGIVFDGGGSFGEHPLLVTGPSGKNSVVAAIDCHGDVQTITASAPRMEGGISVAPATFGAHAGELIGLDEIGGDLIGIRPTGETSTVATLRQPAGLDLGVESGGFVPVDFLKRGGFLYLADRGTANNPHPGTDSILRLSSTQLLGVGIAEGDLLVATEGGGVTVDVSCAAACSLREVAVGPSTGHIEGHIVFLTNLPGQAPPAQAPPSPHPIPSPTPAAPTTTAKVAGLGLAGAGFAVLAVAVVLLVRRIRAG